MASPQGMGCTDPKGGKDTFNSQASTPSQLIGWPNPGGGEGGTHCLVGEGVAPWSQYCRTRVDSWIDSILVGWTPHSDVPATPTLSLEGQAVYSNDESAVDEGIQDGVLEGCGRGKHSISAGKLISETSSVEGGQRGPGLEVVVTTEPPGPGSTEYTGSRQGPGFEVVVTRVLPEPADNNECTDSSDLRGAWGREVVMTTEPPGPGGTSLS